MRQVYIDLTTEHARASNGNFVGYLGEHNATELLITIPQSIVDESDYQIVVFQSGPLVFKTKHISEDRTQPTYRIGNTIHTKLTRSLTKVTGLALQVECYKENDQGEHILVGKTQTVANLVLKPSPEGFPAFNYDGSFEDIEAAIVNAHSHDNLAVLNKFEVSEDGELFFDGRCVEGIRRCQCPSALPAEAEIGMLAIALNDDDENEAAAGITTEKRYAALKWKDNITLPDFSDARYIVGGSTSSQIEVNFTLEDEDGNDIAAVVFIHAPAEDMSFMAMIDQGTTRSARLLYSDLGLRIDGSGGAFMIFNPYKEFDFAAMTGAAAPAFIPIGSCFLAFTKANPRVDSNLNVNYDQIIEVMEDEFYFKDYHLPYLNVKIKGESGYNQEYTDKLLSAVFEEVGNEPKEKGLYVFTKDGWKKLDELINAKSTIVNAFPDLPMDAPDGTLAYVANDAYLFKEQHCSIYKSNKYQALYFAPSYDDFALLYDFQVVIEFWRTINGTDTKYADAISLVTNKEGEYFVLEAKPTNTPNKRYLVYSWKDQTITYQNITGEVKKGWNEVFINTNPVTIRQITFADLPHFIISESSQTLPAWFKAIVLYADNYGGERNWLPMYHFSNDPFGQVDHAKGLWVKTQGDWQKVTETDNYITEE